MRDSDTLIGGGGRFPPTRHSAIERTLSDNSEDRRRAWSSIVESYWKPAYKYIRVKWNRSNEDAKDLTQGFFTQALEKQYFRSYQPAKGSFRGFLRTCLDGYVANQDQAANRLKRGGGAITVPLDFQSAEGELCELPLADQQSTEEFFYREWVRHLFASSLEQLRQECEQAGKRIHFSILERYDVDQTAASYEELAREFGIARTAVTNHLAWSRRQFRRIVLERIREVSGTEEEFQREARLLLGEAKL